jgi:hypothetical protein
LWLLPRIDLQIQARTASGLFALGRQGYRPA